jgi:outer membrane biosynthesis protein TonB
MAEEKDTGFRITDRRKFNPDGSPREHVDEPEPPAAPPAPPLNPEPPPAPEPLPAPESRADNVVSFPRETPRRREPEAPPAEPPPAEPPADEPPAAEPRAADAAADARAAQAKAAASAAEQAYNQTRGPQSPQLPEASFLALIDMFAAEAAMNLGMAQTPDGNRTPVDLEAARHWIDMLGMLEEKTRGNLNDEEASVLENVVAYLRMQFVGASRKR